MAASGTGGDILEIRYSHSIIGDGVFYAKANEGNTLDPGGYRTSDDASLIDGARQPIWQTNLQRAHIEVLCVNDMNVRNDIDVARQLTSSTIEADFTVSMINGTVWGITGKPVGEIQADTNAATFTLKIAGGTMTKIVG